MHWCFAERQCFLRNKHQHYYHRIRISQSALAVGAFTKFVPLPFSRNPPVLLVLNTDGGKDAAS